MSQEHVSLTSQAHDAFNRRDLEAYLALMDTDVETVPRMVAVEGGYHGHEGVRRWWADLFAAMPDFTTEVVEVRDLGAHDLAPARGWSRHHQQRPVRGTALDPHRVAQPQGRVVEELATEAEALAAARQRQRA